VAVLSFEIDFLSGVASPNELALVQLTSVLLKLLAVASILGMTKG